MPEAEFVTVAEAARALQLSERQVRRYAGRMAESDRLTPDATAGPSPARVRLSALAALAGKVIIEGNATGETSGPLPEVTGSSPAYAGHDDRPPGESVRPVYGVVSEDLATLREQLASVTAERDGLTARLADTQADRDAWKEQAREATLLARVAQDEVRSARLIGQRPMQQIEALETPGGSQSSPDVPSGVIDRTEQEKRPFWAFWRR